MTPHHHGLEHDLDTIAAQAVQRRRALRWLAIGSLTPIGLWGCGGGGDDAAAVSDSTATTPSTGASGTCSVIPEETAGPYPGDGSNSNAGGVVNALALSGIVRSDIRSSIAGATGTAAGVPTTVTLTLVNTNGSCAGLAGYAIYLWHCDQAGGYSLYSAGVTDQNYLRGVQATDANGQATFTTVFPGCYAGRWPHMHLEVYPSLAAASVATNKIRTSQLAIPAAACSAVYATSGYGASVANFAQISLATDNVFRDGATLETASATGDAGSGFALALQVGIAV